MMRPAVFLLATLALVEASEGPRAQAASALAIGLQHGPTATAGEPFSLQWRRRVLGGDVGYSGFEVADLDGDGRSEIVSTGDTGYGTWYVMSWDGSDYQQTFFQPGTNFADNITALRIANVDSDPRPEIVILRSNGISVHDGRTRALKATFPVAAYASDMAIGDVDSDGQAEIVVVGNAQGFDVYSALTGLLEYHHPTIYSSYVRIGDVDGLPGKEIVVSGTGGFSIIDGVSHALEWQQTFNGVTNGSLTTGDLNGDGAEEVVLFSQFDYSVGGIAVYNVAARVRSATLEAKHSIRAARVADVDADGSMELVYADATTASLRVLDAASLSIEWSLPTSGLSGDALAFGDVDGDGAREVVLGGGSLSVIGGLSHALEWRRQDAFYGPFRSFASADIDADGNPELLTAATYGKSSFVTAPWFAHDAATGRIEFVEPIVSEFDRETIRLATANVDGDPQNEVFVLKEDHDGAVVAYDGLTHAIQWRRGAFMSGMGFRSLALADFDMDGSLDLAVGTSSESTGVPGTYVYLLDPRTGAPKWRSPFLASMFSALNVMKVGNVDADPEPEIVVGSDSGESFVLDVVDGTTHPLANVSMTALELWDIDGDGIEDVLIGTATGLVQHVDAVTGAVLRAVATFDQPVNALAARDFDASPGVEFVAAVGEELIAFRPSGCVVWKSPRAGAAVGADDGLLAGDIDDDGRYEVVARVGGVGFDVYESRMTPPDACVDNLLALSISDATVVEGNAGFSLAVFTVSLSKPSALTVNVMATTADGSALAASDYTAVSAPLVFTPGVTSLTVAVPVKGDALLEGDETFKVVLSGAINAPIGDGEGVGTILNDEPATRTFVAPNGYDVGSCSLQTAPCRSIAAAIARTATDGEVIILGSGDYDIAPIVVDRGLKITASEGVVALVRQPIVVNAPGGKVVLRGLTIKGGGAGDGVVLVAASSVSIENSIIDRWAVGVRIPSAVAALVSIDHSSVSQNANGVQAAAGATTRIAVEGGRFDGNGTALDLGGGSCAIRESTFVNNSVGVLASQSEAAIHRSEFLFNVTGLKSLAGGVIRTGRSQVLGNGTGLHVAGGLIESSGTNLIRNNTVDSVGAVTPVSEQ